LERRSVRQPVNSFLDNFGLAFAGSNVLFSNDSIDDIADPLFTGVTRLFYAGVNPVSVTGSSAAASIAEFRDSTSTFGLIGVYNDSPGAPIPEPGGRLTSRSSTRGPFRESDPWGFDLPTQRFTVDLPSGTSVVLESSDPGTVLTDLKVLETVAGNQQIAPILAYLKPRC
jgi:hypothetical protein